MDINTDMFKSKHKFAEVPIDEHYRIGLLNDLFSLKTQFAYFEEEGFSSIDIDCMINDVCTS